MDTNELLEHYKLALSVAEIGFWNWDIVKNELIWDDKMYSVYRIERDNFTGAYDAWESSLHPEDLENAKSLLNEVLENKREKYDTVFRIVCSDGCIRHIRAFGHALRDESGKAIRAVGLNWDISEKILAETELKEKMAELERLNKFMVDREKKMIELKNELAELKGES